MRFEWDDKKAVSNLKKHGVSFKMAVTAFDDPFALMALDEKHSQKEQREWLIGMSDAGILVVIFTKRMEGEVWRLISARTASRKEIQTYEDYKRVPI